MSAETSRKRIFIGIIKILLQIWDIYRGLISIIEATTEKYFN
jgi:hypothetical protein